MVGQPARIVRRLRKKRALSRRGLARVARVPLSAVRRIEYGMLARIDEATRICLALETPADEVFKQAFERLRKVKGREELANLAWNDATFRAEMASGGIDIHPAEWTLKVRMTGGGERFFDISRPDLDRLWDCLPEVEGDGGSRFFRFEGRDVSVAVGLRHLVHVHAMFDSPGNVQRKKGEPERIEILLAGDRKFHVFDAEPDEREDGEEPSPCQGQLGDLMESLPAEEEGFVSFLDGDGERAGFATASLAMVCVPHWLLWGCDDEPEMEEGPREPTRRRRPGLKLLRGGAR